MSATTMTETIDAVRRDARRGRPHQTRLVPPEYAQLLLPKLSDEQLDALHRYGAEEPTFVGEVLSAAGDPSYDLMVVLSGAVRAFDLHEGVERDIVTLLARDFIAELNLLTGERVYVTSVVTESGRILRVPRAKVKVVIDEQPVLGELLVQTMFRRRDAFLQIRAGVQIIGSRYSKDTQRLREFAARNRLAHAWVDLDAEPAALGLLERLGLQPRDTPVVLLAGGEVLANPTNSAFAGAVGIFDDEPPQDLYDVVVVGAGPSGLAAAVYASSEGLATAVLDGVAAGGQAATTSRIENYLGFPTGVSGEEFAERALLQALKFGAKMMVPQSAVSISRPDGHYTLTLSDGSRLNAKAVVIATGVSYRRLAVPGIEEFEGMGVSYTPIDLRGEAPDQEPAVIVGGGNSAGQAAVKLAGEGRRVILVVRGDDLAATMSSYLVDRIRHDPLIEILRRALVTGVSGGRFLESVRVRTCQTGTRSIATHALYVLIGAEPHTEWLAGAVALDDHGFVLTGPNIPEACLDDSEWVALARRPLPLETNRPGVFAVGDVRADSIKRVASAAGEGSMAVRLVQQYLNQGSP